MISELIINYVNDRDEISVPELQYVLGIDYKEARDALLTLKSRGVITPCNNGNKFTVKRGILIGKELDEKDCARLAHELSLPTLKFLGSLFDEASAPCESIEDEELGLMLQLEVIQSCGDLYIITISPKCFKSVVDIYIGSYGSPERAGIFKKRSLTKRMLLSASTFTDEDRKYEIPLKPNGTGFKPRFSFLDKDADDDSDDNDNSSDDDDDVSFLDLFNSDDNDVDNGGGDNSDDNSGDDDGNFSLFNFLNFDDDGGDNGGDGE